VTGGLRGTASPPVVGAGAVVNAASFVPQTPLAPGSLVSIFGSRLSEGRDAARALPLENLLAGTLVTVGGRPLPLLYDSEGQVNAMLPYSAIISREGVSL
jgi:uncharacterized protein (TIGR03437 family)